MLEPLECLGSAALQVKRCLNDPGVRKELASWRWRMIQYLGGFYVVLAVLVGGAQALFHARDGHADSQPHLMLVTAHGGSTTLTRKSPGKSLATIAEPLLTGSDLVASYETQDERQCARENAQLAVGQLVKYQDEAREASPPIVLGGIGDSGTRAVAYIVTQLGVWMGKFGLTVKKDSRDSKLFINGFQTTTCDARGKPANEVVKSFVFYGNSIEGCRSAAYNRSCVNTETWNQGVQWTSVLFRTMWNHTKVFTARRSNRDKFPFGLWGYKHPRSALVLPYIKHVTREFRYVHILRDGRDISAGDNTLFFNTCKKYYGVSAPCEDTYEMRLELWSRLNLDVLNWAKANLRDDQFLVVRIEDLVKGYRSCFERIAHFTGTSKDRAEQVINQSIKLFTVKQNRYFGQKYSPSERKMFTDAVRNNKWAVAAFAAYGYGIDEWDTKGDCATMTFPMSVPSSV